MDKVNQLSAPNRACQTPLMIAAKLGKIAAFQELLKMVPQESHDAVDKNGKSVIYLAAQGNHVAILEVCALDLLFYTYTLLSHTCTESNMHTYTHTYAEFQGIS